MLGNFACFCCHLLIFFSSKLTFFQFNYLSVTLSESSSLDPDYFESKLTLGRRQLKMLSATIDKRGSNINRNSVFNCHLSPVWRQMAIVNTVSIDFLSPFFDSMPPTWCETDGNHYQQMEYM